MMLRTRKDDYDLGPTLEFMKAMRELSQMVITDARDYPHIFGIIQLNDERVGVKWIREMAMEAREALRLYKPELSAHSKWVLGRLARISREHRPKGRRA